MSIYFIQAASGGPVKIGFTATCPWKRLGEIQVSSPDRLLLVGLSAGDEPKEKALHDELRAHRVRGEWFEPVSAVLEKIETFAPKRVKEIGPDDHPLRKWRIENGWTLRRLAKATGGGYAQLSRIETRNHRPSFLLFAQLVKITSGAVCVDDFLLEGDQQ